MQEFLDFASALDDSITFRPVEADAVPVNSKFDTGCVWLKNGGKGFIYVPISDSGRRKLKTDVEYFFQPNDQGDDGWKVSRELKLIRKKE